MPAPQVTTDEIDAISRKRRPTHEEITAWMRFLHEKHAPDLPAKVFNRLYDKAYRDGRSGGYHEVDQNLTELIELADGIVADLGLAPTETRSR